MAMQDLPPAIAAALPRPTEVYDPAYMRRLVSMLDDQLRQLKGARRTLIAGATVYELPTAITGLRTGEVYNDGGTLKVAP